MLNNKSLSDDKTDKNNQSDAGKQQTSNEVSTDFNYSNPNSPIKIHNDAFYGLAGIFVRFISPNTEADPAGLLLQLLACFGNIVGNKPHFEIEADNHSPRLFVLLVGPTSKGRKGTSFGHIKRLLTSADPSWSSRIRHGLSSGEGIISAVSDEYSENTTEIADKRLMIVQTEFALALTNMKRNGNTLSPTLREAWDDDNLNILTKYDPLTATDTHISMIGHITKDDLMSNLDDVSIQNGLANRFLIGYVERSKFLPLGGSIDKTFFDLYIHRFQEAIRHTSNIEQVTFDDKSSDLWTDIYKDLSEGNTGIIEALTSRAAPYVLRLAVCYALLDCTDKIRVEHLNAALAVWRYVEWSTRHIFLSNETEIARKLGQRIWVFLKESKGGRSRTEISTFLGNNISATDISNALQYLYDDNKRAYSEIFKTDGRDKTVWKAK